jgi:hypothetical protein
MADEDLRREARELTILTGAFLKLAERLHARARALEAAAGEPTIAPDPRAVVSGAVDEALADR